MKYTYLLLTIFLLMTALKGNCFRAEEETTSVKNVSFISGMVYSPVFMAGVAHGTKNTFSSSSAIGDESSLPLAGKKNLEGKRELISPKASSGSMDKIVEGVKSVARFARHHPLQTLVGAAVVYDLITHNLRGFIKEIFLNFVVEPGKKIGAKLVLKAAWWDLKMDLKFMWKNIVKVAATSVTDELAHERLLFCTM